MAGFTVKIKKNGTFLLTVWLIVISFNLLANHNLPSANPDRIILNLTGNNNTSVAVTWRTDKSVVQGFCELHPMTGSKINPEKVKTLQAKTTTVIYKYKDEPEVKVNQHSVIIDNLTPGEKYLYRVGIAGNFSEWLEIAMPSNDDKFSFVYFGDPQTEIKSQWSRVIRKAYNIVPDCSFMLYGGDIINRGGCDVEWQEWFDAGSYIFATIPQVLTPGNHDYTDEGIDTHWHYQFSQPQNGPGGVKGTCFYTDYKYLRVISIDSAVDDELEDENGPAMKNQKAWLDSVLTNNDRKWVVVTTHLPFYSTNIKRDNAQLRKHFQPILEKHKVDLVLTGHDHAYGRGIVSDNPNIKPSIVYVVSVSGPKQYEAGDKNWMQKRGSNLQLFQQISIDGNELTYSAISVDGKIFDQFKLKKKKDGTTKFIDQSEN